ncbi:MAG TPA: tetratricopeptide repeat protein [Pyrinomonadaceae bacterium]|jgi:tetratricopeptide (TPR) repeat protein
MKLSQARFAVVLLVIVASGSGCGFVNRIRAKNALNEGAQAYRQGRFAEAQEKFQHALELDPSQKNAPVFIARSIQQQYRPGVDTPENRAKAEGAIEAYKRVLANDPGNEDAYNAVAYLYRQMREEDKESEWLMQRATLNDAPKEKRSDAYTVLASKQWNCAYEITEQKENKETVQKPDAVIIQYKKPKEQSDFDKARNCALKGLELAEQAISLNPNNPNAWSYKTNLLREMAKLAQMDGKPDERTKFDQQANEAETTQKRLNEEAEQKKAAEEAQKSPTPPAS